MLIAGLLALTSRTHASDLKIHGVAKLNGKTTHLYVNTIDQTIRLVQDGGDSYSFSIEKHLTDLKLISSGDHIPGVTVGYGQVTLEDLSNETKENIATAYGLLNQDEINCKGDIVAFVNYVEADKRHFGNCFVDAGN